MICYGLCMIVGAEKSADWMSSDVLMVRRQSESVLRCVAANDCDVGVNLRTQSGYTLVTDV